MNITNDYRRELKSKIIEYAMNEFRQRGIKAVKMDEISRGLHVSKRTVYEIFGDKEELLLAGIRAQNEELRRMLDQFASENNHNVIDIICYVHCSIRMFSFLFRLFSSQSYKKNQRNLPLFISFLLPLHKKYEIVHKKHNFCKNIKL